jgi:protein TonB
MRTYTKITLAIAGGSLGLHLAAWACVGFIKGERRHDAVAISLAESKKKEEKKKQDPPKPVEVKPEKAKVIQPAIKTPEPLVEKVAPQEPQPQNNMSGFADLGIGPLGNSGGGGIPIGGGGGGGGGGPPPPVSTTTQRHAVLTPATECSEELVKPKLEHQIQPAYTQEGRQANAEGAVQLEITVDATGHVVSVKILHGLGFGLDEAAMTAARQWTFAPATKCGKAVPTTIKGKVRFSLS